MSASRAAEAQTLGPTRPDKIAIWPVEADEFGIDVLYRGARGRQRAIQVQRRLGEVGVTTRFEQELDGAWRVRLGPVGRGEMLAVLSEFVW